MIYRLGYLVFTFKDNAGALERIIYWIHDIICSSSRWPVPSCLTLRFNCGTGAAQIISDSRVVVGQWHTVTVFRDGMSGWLRMDNDTPISGRSQVTEWNRRP